MSCMGIGFFPWTVGLWRFPKSRRYPESIYLFLLFWWHQPPGYKGPPIDGTPYIYKPNTSWSYFHQVSDFIIMPWWILNILHICQQHLIFSLGMYILTQEKIKALSKVDPEWKQFNPYLLAEENILLFQNSKKTFDLQSCRCWRRYWQVMQERSFTEPDYDKLRTGLSQKYVPMSKKWTYCIPKVFKNGLSTSRVPKTQYSFWNRQFAGQIAACSCSHASDIFHGMKYMAFSEIFSCHSGPK